MSRDALIQRGRAAAERGMVDACVIRRRAGEPVVDDNTGEVTAAVTDVYTGRCEFQQNASGGAARAVQPGEDFQLLLQLVLKLPIAAPALEVGDEVTVTAAALDEQLVGQVFLVRDLFVKTHATARRVGITRRTS